MFVLKLSGIQRIFCIKKNLGEMFVLKLYGIQILLKKSFFFWK